MNVSPYFTEAAHHRGVLYSPTLAKSRCVGRCGRPSHALWPAQAGEVFAWGGGSPHRPWPRAARWPVRWPVWWPSRGRRAVVGCWPAGGRWVGSGGCALWPACVAVAKAADAAFISVKSKRPRKQSKNHDIENHVQFPTTRRRCRCAEVDAVGVISSASIASQMPPLLHRRPLPQFPLMPS